MYFISTTAHTLFNLEFIPKYPIYWHQGSRALMINYNYNRKDKLPVAIVETWAYISLIIKKLLRPVFPRCVDLCYQHLLWITWSCYFHSTAPMGVYENNYTLYNFDCTERKNSYLACNSDCNISFSFASHLAAYSTQNITINMPYINLNSS